MSLPCPSHCLVQCQVHELTIFNDLSLYIDNFEMLDKREEINKKYVLFSKIWRGGYFPHFIGG